MRLEGLRTNFATARGRDLMTSSVSETLRIRMVRMSVLDCELVRGWRNDPAISRYMEFREHITAEMQRQWFGRINNDRNYYFVIEANGERLGVINLKDIDRDRRTGEAGVFLIEHPLRT